MCSKLSDSKKILSYPNGEEFNITYTRRTMFNPAMTIFTIIHSTGRRSS